MHYATVQIGCACVSIHTHFLQPIVNPETKSNDITAWLGELKLSTAVPDDESSIFQLSDGFDMIGTPATSEGSSIEIVPHTLDKVRIPSSVIIIIVYSYRSQVHDKGFCHFFLFISYLLFMGILLDGLTDMEHALHCVVS